MSGVLNAPLPLLAQEDPQNEISPLHAHIRTLVPNTQGFGGFVSGSGVDGDDCTSIIPTSLGSGGHCLRSRVTDEGRERGFRVQAGFRVC
eukprot:948118-Pyramimonas_sp.AAC.2